MRLYREGLESVKWQIPSLFNNDLSAITFKEVLDRVYPEFPHCTIYSTYGSFATKWNSGRVASFPFSESDIQYFINYYHNILIECYFTFSNYNLTEDDLDDINCNYVLDYLEFLNSECNGDHGVIVSSDLLRNYIRSEYPKLKIESSVLKPTYEYPDYDETPDYYNQLLDRYDTVVIRPECIDDDFFMKKLSDPSRCIILVNQTCVPYCEKAISHYNFYNDVSAGKTGIAPECSQVYMDCCSIDYYRMIELVDMGFTNFKLQGRNISSNDFLNMLSSYVFEPTGDIQMILNYVRKKINSAYQTGAS